MGDVARSMAYSNIHDHTMTTHHRMFVYNSP